MTKPSSNSLDTVEIHPLFGVEVRNCDLRSAHDPQVFAAIRDAFETHSLLLFRNQHLDDEDHLVFAKRFGPIEDRSNVRMDGAPKISGVSNETDDGQVMDESNLRLLDLQANMLWHTDSTFLPVPALANVLQARIVPSEGGATEFASTRAGFAALSAQMQDQLRTLTFHHRYSHSRARINPELAKLKRFTMWPDTQWRAVWRNPVTNEEALYIASHVFAVSVMGQEEGDQFVQNLIAQMTQESAVYAHHWQPGDVIVWDERAVLHRGTPWPYDQPRTLVSVCVSAGDSDGLSTMRPGQAA